MKGRPSYCAVLNFRAIVLERASIAFPGIREDVEYEDEMEIFSLKPFSVSCSLNGICRTFALFIDVPYAGDFVDSADNNEEVYKIVSEELIERIDTPMRSRKDELKSEKAVLDVKDAQIRHIIRAQQVTGYMIYGGRVVSPFAPSLYEEQLSSVRPQQVRTGVSQRLAEVKKLVKDRRRRDVLERLEQVLEDTSNLKSSDFVNVVVWCRSETAIGPYMQCLASTSKTGKVILTFNPDATDDQLTKSGLKQAKDGCEMHWQTNGNIRCFDKTTSGDVTLEVIHPPRFFPPRMRK